MSDFTVHVHWSKSLSCWEAVCPEEPDCPHGHGYRPHQASERLEWNLVVHNLAKKNPSGVFPGAPPGGSGGRSVEAGPVWGEN